jgi:hypothetical protein
MPIVSSKDEPKKKEITEERKKEIVKMNYRYNPIHNLDWGKHQGFIDNLEVNQEIKHPQLIKLFKQFLKEDADLLLSMPETTLIVSRYSKLLTYLVHYKGAAVHLHTFGSFTRDTYINVDYSEKEKPKYYRWNYTTFNTSHRNKYTANGCDIMLSSLTPKEHLPIFMSDRYDDLVEEDKKIKELMLDKSFYTNYKLSPNFRKFENYKQKKKEEES